MNFNFDKTADLVVLQITDTHIFTNQNEEFDGINTTQTLEKILKQINADFPNFDFLIVTGDLVHDPDKVAYENLLNSMQLINQPIFYLPGNHDDPSMMKDQFQDNFRSKIQTKNWTVLFLDSHKPASHGGYLSETKLQALQANLNTAKNNHVLICLHHHPVSINSPWMDTMMLENADQLFKVLDQYDNVKGVIWGHIHQEFNTERQGVKLMGSPSTCAQFEPGAKQFGLDDMKPGYRWLRLKPSGSIETGVERLKTPHCHASKQD